jgi:hypothetical protein
MSIIYVRGNRRGNQEWTNPERQPWPHKTKIAKHNAENKPLR